MSKSLTKRGPACSCRHAAAMRGELAGARTSSLPHVAPSTNRTTSTLTPGAKAITSGAAPDAAAAHGVRVLDVAIDGQQRALR